MFNPPALLWSCSLILGFLLNTTHIHLFSEEGKPNVWSQKRVSAGFPRCRSLITLSAHLLKSAANVISWTQPRPGYPGFWALEVGYPELDSNWTVVSASPRDQAELLEKEPLPHSSFKEAWLQIAWLGPGQWEVPRACRSQGGACVWPGWWTHKPGNIIWTVWRNERSLLK